MTTQYRVLWASPYALHDTSSGAAILVKTMMEKLHERGFAVTALSCFIFDSPVGTSRFPNLEDQLAKSTDNFHRITDAGITYHYMKTQSRLIRFLQEGEMRTFFAQYCHAINSLRPDVILMYGCGLLEMGLRAEAKRRGIPVVYVLCNGNHGGYAFPDIDLVISDSYANASLYSQRDGVNVHPVGAFIKLGDFLAKERKPKYITFINPCVEKGISMVARLALMAQKALPNERFLVVQSRGDWFNTLASLRSDENPEYRVTKDMYPNVDVANHTQNMAAIYSQTKVCLIPSLWYEGFGRVAVEATLNGIPCLTSQSGGLPEAVQAGGITLPAPEGSRKTYTRIPTEAEMQPWLEALQKLVSDMNTPQGQAHWDATCKEAAKTHDLDTSTDRLIQTLHPLLQRRASQNPLLMRSATVTLPYPTRTKD